MNGARGICGRACEQCPEKTCGNGGGGNFHAHPVHSHGFPMQPLLNSYRCLARLMLVRPDEPHRDRILDAHLPDEWDPWISCAGEWPGTDALILAGARRKP